MTTTSNKSSSPKNWEDIKTKAADATSSTHQAEAATETLNDTTSDTATPSSQQTSHQAAPRIPDSAKELEDWQAEVKQLKKDNEQLQEEADNNHNKWLREIANARTLQNRANKSIEEAQKFALERFVKDLLQVLDSLDKALEHSTDKNNENTDNILQGVTLTAKMLVDTLANHGVEMVDPVGQNFDPQYHEALTMQATTEAQPNTILATVQKGYILNGRLLRPARVVVAKAAE